MTTQSTQNDLLRDRLAKIWELPDDSKILMTISKRKAHAMRKGTILFNEGDPVNFMYFIKEGYAKAYRISEEGKDTMNYLVGPGYMIGFRMLMLQEKVAQYSAEAITDCVVYSLTYDEYLDGVAEHPELLVDQIRSYGDRLDYTERKLEGFIYSSTTARVAIFLADCVRRFGKNKNGEISLPFPLTHQKIADFVGSFRETVTLAIKRLEKEGVLESERGNVHIRNLRKLREYTVFTRK
ncbi:MAG: Crp/Fnr family transcriptional regulator [bacterium]|nr:Crp/Fnr family transcriptional regulator [bacterium]